MEIKPGSRRITFRGCRNPLKNGKNRRKPPKPPKMQKSTQNHYFNIFHSKLIVHLVDKHLKNTPIFALLCRNFRRVCGFKKPPKSRFLQTHINPRSWQ